MSAAAGQQAEDVATHKLKQRLCERERKASRSAALGGGCNGAAECGGKHDEVTWCTDAFVRDIPKCDLHVHLDGSLRIETVIELAKEAGVALPSTDPDELRRKVFKDQYKNLEEYLECFMYTTAVMQSAVALERVAYEFAVDNYSENVVYFEVRFAPQLHCTATPTDGFGIVEVVAAVNKGLRRARDEFNARLASEISAEAGAGAKAASAANEARGDGKPPYYEYGIIVCAMRKFAPGFSRYYDQLFSLHPHADDVTVTSMASVNLAQAAVVARDKHGLPIVGIDIAGAEADNKAADHKEAFQIAHSNAFGKTVHAGEGFGPESIWQAVRDLHAERIGHGFHLFSADKVVGSRHMQNPELFVKQLVKFVSDRRIALEVCLTSNLNTMPALKSSGLENHAFAKMVHEMVSVTLATDNRLVSNTTVSREVGLAVRTFGLSAKQLRDIVFCGMKRSFFPGPYPERRRFARAFMDMYDAVAAKHDIPGPSHPDFKVRHRKC